MRIRKNNFIEKTLVQVASFFKDAIFTEEYVSQKAFLQKLNPQVKIISFLSFILATLFIRNVYAIFILYGFIILLAGISKINILYFLKRTWIFIPIFSLFIAVPAMFNFFSPGDIVFSFRVLHFNLSITQQGLYGALLFISRVVTSVSIVVLLNLTTRHSDIFHTLSIFKVPSIFIMTIGMCYRYIYFFIEMLEGRHLAVKSRVGGIIATKEGQKIVSKNMANMWYKSYHMHIEIYNSMRSRGYLGQTNVIDTIKPGYRDWSWMLISMGFCVGLLFL